MHCDVEPRNFLLDAELSLRIADFSGSSLEGFASISMPGDKIFIA